jgi:hypothetical protein
MGLSTILSERCGIECVSRIAALQRLFVLPAGPMPPNPIELLEGPVFRRVLSSGDANFDAIVIDTPAAEAGTDALIIGSRAGSTALVVRANRTRANSISAFTKALAAAKASMLGVVCIAVACTWYLVCPVLATTLPHALRIAASAAPFDTCLELAQKRPIDLATRRHAVVGKFK